MFSNSTLSTSRKAAPLGTAAAGAAVFLQWCKCSILVLMRSVCLLFLAISIQAAAGQAPGQAPSAEADSFLRTGIAAQQRGDMKAAIEAYRKALAIRPELADAR